MNSSLSVIILAAGLGKRMGLGLPKVVTATYEMPLIHHVLSAVDSLHPSQVIVVVGHQREKVEECILKGAEEKKYSREPISFAFQEKQLGTGDAVKAALPYLSSSNEVLILAGDVPLLTPSTLGTFVKSHCDNEATISIATFEGDASESYGRMLRDIEGFVVEIIERKDCTSEQAALTEFNSGAYIVDTAFLVPAVNGLTNENAQNEYYLTDIVGRAKREGQRVAAFKVADSQEALGVNSPRDLSIVNSVLLTRSRDQALNAGVIFEDITSAFIDSRVQFGKGVKFGPNVSLKGACVIGDKATFEGFAYLQDCVVEEGATIKFSVRAERAIIGKGCSVGPFAHLRPSTTLGEYSKVGNFVETKNTSIGAHAAVSHLTYLGDSTIGARCNIGAGTITCNYDGSKKSRTILEEDVFVGSNSSLVAPLVIGARSTIGAGSVIQKDVPADTLALTRAPLKLKEGFKRKAKC